MLAVAFAHGLLATGGDGSRVLLWDAARPGAARVLRSLMAGAVKARPASAPRVRLVREEGRDVST